MVAVEGMATPRAPLRDGAPGELKKVGLGHRQENARLGRQARGKSREAGRVRQQGKNPLRAQGVAGGVVYGHARSLQHGIGDSILCQPRHQHRKAQEKDSR